MMKEEIQQQQQKLDRKRKEGAEKSCVNNPGTFLGCGNKWSLFAELKLLWRNTCFFSFFSEMVTVLCHAKFEMFNYNKIPLPKLLI